MCSSDLNIEILLRARGVIHHPPRPWEPEETVVEKLFFDNERITEAGPSTVTIALRRKKLVEVDYVLIDDDELPVDNPNTLPALVAACLKSSQYPLGKEFDVEQLWSESEVWPEGLNGVKRGLDHPVQYLRDHVKRPFLKDQMSVASKGQQTTKIKCQIIVKGG